MLVFVGLGNTDSKYLNTKHNVGFWAIDMFAKKHNLEFKAGKGDYVFAKTEDMLIAKTTTFMNHSGLSVKRIIDYFNITDLTVY